MGDIQMLVDATMRGDIRAAGRAMTLMESGGASACDLATLFANRTSGRARVIGVTGLPGAGKSEIIDQLIECFKVEGERIGVVAVDPSSPIHGGAILGDRIRWMRHATSESVIIRSVASRGSIGGLSMAVEGIVSVLHASGCKTILVETVGMGQVGCDIAGVGDIVVNVIAPGLGDEIQMMKSGLVDAVDIMVLNKVDLPGFEATLEAVRYEVEHRNVPLVETCAVKGHGIACLVETMNRVLQSPSRPARLRERKTWQVVERTLALLREVLLERLKTEKLDRSVDEHANELVREWSAAGKNFGENRTDE